MYERRSDPLLPPPLFLRRLGLHVLVATGAVLVSLVIGTLGYHGWGRQSWLDAFLNAAMLLGGMGQVGEPATSSGKLFAAIFALYAGLVLILVTTLIITPVLHRVLHSVHLEPDEPGEGEPSRRKKSG
jgi:hypothetical protein